MRDKIKYAVLVGDGMADWAKDFPEGKTPLVAAATPHMDSIAGMGEAGLVRTVPEGMDPGSDVANMSLMGCDPRLYYTGRAPLEAASMGIELTPGQVAFRCNLVHLEQAGEKKLSPDSVMGSYSAGHITTEEAREIIEDLDRGLGRSGRRFYPGVSYRHLLVLDDSSLSIRLTPPHDITGRSIGPYFPEGEGSENLREIMDKAALILADHPVNKCRVEEGKLSANSVWFWGHGSRPGMPTLKEGFGLTGAVVSAVDLIKGLGRMLGMDVLDVPGATGYLDTNYEGKVEAALDSLEKVDLVFVHVEAPDEAGHQGDPRAKIKAIEDFDSRVVGPFLKGIGKFPLWAVMVVTDHPTPLSIMTHAGDPVPYAILRSDHVGGKLHGRLFNEISLSGSDVLPGGEALIRSFLGG